MAEPTTTSTCAGVAAIVCSFATYIGLDQIAIFWALAGALFAVGKVKTRNSGFWGIFSLSTSTILSTLCAAGAATAFHAWLGSPKPVLIGLALGAGVAFQAGGGRFIEEAVEAVVSRIRSMGGSK